MKVLDGILLWIIGMVVFTFLFYTCAKTEITTGIVIDKTDQTLIVSNVQTGIIDPLLASTDVRYKTKIKDRITVVHKKHFFYFGEITNINK